MNRSIARIFKEIKLWRWLLPAFSNPTRRRFLPQAVWTKKQKWQGDHTRRIGNAIWIMHGPSKRTPPPRNIIAPCSTSWQREFLNEPKCIARLEAAPHSSRSSKIGQCTLRAFRWWKSVLESDTIVLLVEYWAAHHIWFSGYLNASFYFSSDKVLLSLLRPVFTGKPVSSGCARATSLFLRSSDWFIICQLANISTNIHTFFVVETVHTEQVKRMKLW